MAVCTPKRMAAILVGVWLVTMVYIWFPDFIPLAKDKRNEKNKDSYRLEASKLSNDSDAVHVCITSDKSRLGGMMALVNSIHSNTKHPVVFHLVVDKDSMDHARKWLRTKKLKDVKYELKLFPEKWVEGKIVVRGGRKELASPLNFARYYLPALFPSVSGKMIYLDDDCIVQGDISELLSTVKLDEGHITAFTSDCEGAAKRLTLMKNNYAEYIDFKNQHVRKLKINPKECSFNAGVFIADLTLWKKYNITKQLEYWMTLNTKEEVYGNEKGGGASQPPMLIVFYKKYAQLDPSWHVKHLGLTSGTSYTRKFISKAKLLHWNGRFKPWGRVAQHSNVWDRYYVEDPLHKFKVIRKQ